MERNIIISLENLTKIYPIYNSKKDRMREALSSKRVYHIDFEALKNVDLQIYKGETIGIIGQNGSGKSTLLKILAGVISPTSGKAEIKGKVSAMLELGAGFNPEMTGMQNIYLNGAILGYSRVEMERRIPKILEFADIGDFINQPVKTYSSGMFARLAFATAINVEPEILIVDEVLSVGDMRFQLKCISKMKSLMDEGVTVLFVTHDINATRRFCTRNVWINNGNIVMDGDVNLVADSYLNFLKLGDANEARMEIQDEIENSDTNLKPFQHCDGIAEIIDFQVKNSYGNRINYASFDEELFVDITYDVYDDKVKNPVLGVALLGIDDEYLCGLNTKLDGVQIPWKYGRNKFRLTYPDGLRVLGGKYYFDAGLFEENATIYFDYKKYVYDFTIQAEYKAEGKYVINHVWE